MTRNPNYGLVLILLGLMFWKIEARVYDRCDLARTLRQQNMPGNLGVCTAYYESRFDTAAIGKANADGSSDNGIFQINSNYWCRDPAYPGIANGCNIDCSSLRNDNINDDISCAKTIYYSQGISAWVAYNNYCRGKDNSWWINGCGV